jgi:hypothetical protein
MDTARCGRLLIFLGRRDDGTKSEEAPEDLLKQAFVALSRARRALLRMPPDARLGLAKVLTSAETRSSGSRDSARARTVGSETHA